MKRSIFNTLIILALGLGTSLASMAQPFEGVVEFTKTTGPVITHYKYFVKGDFIRIEEIGAKGDVQGVMLADTRDRTVKALSPERKLFMDVPNLRLPKDVNVKVEKTNQTKTMAGYTCEKWVVSSAEEDRKVEYWVAADEFDFFIPLLQTLNRKDKQAVYFLEIPDAVGVFPMLGVETKGDGTEVTKLEVTKISRAENNTALFQIPPNYNKFERN